MILAFCFGLFVGSVVTFFGIGIWALATDPHEFTIGR